MNSFCNSQVRRLNLEAARFRAQAASSLTADKERQQQLSQLKVRLGKGSLSLCCLGKTPFVCLHTVNITKAHFMD